MLSKMSKEQLELLSYTKIAEMYLKENKKTMNTADLDLDEREYEDKIADFFESLTTSKEFILLNDGNWDLRTNHSVKIDMGDIYDESDSDDEITEDEEDDIEMSEEDNYEDDSYDKDIDDDDLVDDDYSDLSIVDEDELDSEN